MLTQFFARNWWLLFPSLLLLLLPAYFNLLQPGYFSMHDDVQIMRLFEMKKCFQDLQLPCRWTSDFGAGFGHPLFNYHPVFPYYLGMLFRFSGLNLILSAKILFLLSLIIPGIFMYVLLKEFFSKFVALSGAIAYIFAPYHAVDIYVRGALTESWGMAFFPIIWWSIYQYIKERKPRYWFTAVLSLSGLFLSHNIMMLLFGPISLVWAIYWIIIFKTNPLKIFMAFVLAFGISSFFVLPALLETNLLTVNQIGGYYNFRDHFVDFNQLILSRHWGYGPSIKGFDDDLSFQIGWPQVWLGFLALILIVFAILKKHLINKTVLYLGIFAAIIFVGSIFMSTITSAFIWEALPLLSFVQFPWRWLGIIIFANSLLTGVFLSIVPQKIKGLVLVVIIMLSVSLNYSYFRAYNYYPKTTDQNALSGGIWSKQSMSTLDDYVPKTVISKPSDLAPNSAQLVQGKGKIQNFVLKSNRFSFYASVESNQSLVSVPIFYFPNWQVKVDGLKQNVAVDKSLGVIQISLPNGDHLIEGFFANTILRSAANGISLVSIGIFLVLIAPRKLNYRHLIEVFNKPRV